MDERTEANQITATDVNEDFEREISLHRLIGNKSATDILRTVAEQHLNDSLEGRYPQFSPIILVGIQTRTTMAHCVHNSFANLNFIETSAYFMSQYAQGVHTFFDSNSRYDTYFIKDLELLNAHCQLQLYKIFKNKRISVLDKEDNTWSQQRFNRLVILSASKIDALSSLLLNEIPIKINLGSYSEEDIVQILRQRISFLNWSVSSDELLKNIAQVCGGNIKRCMEILGLSHKISRGNNMDILTEKHVNGAFNLIDKNITAAASHKSVG